MILIFLFKEKFNAASNIPDSPIVFLVKVTMWILWSNLIAELIIILFDILIYTWLKSKLYLLFFNSMKENLQFYKLKKK